jgi:hypothetical protein
VDSITSAVETNQQLRDLTEIVTQKSPYRVVPSPRQSELQQLASWFHQDWKLFFPDFYTGLRIYLDNLPAGRRAALGSY